jgi:serine protein kinase
LIDEFESIVDAPKDSTEKDAFRQNVISRIGAWSLDHPKEQMVYAKVFPEYWQKLERHYYESQKALLTRMHDALLNYDGGHDSDTDQSEGGQLARQTVANMRSKLGYCDKCAKEVIIFLMRQRY